MVLTEFQCAQQLTVPSEQLCSIAVGRFEFPDKFAPTQLTTTYLRVGLNALTGPTPLLS